MMIYLSFFIFLILAALVVSTIVRLRIFNRPYFGKEYSTQPDHSSELIPHETFEHILPPKTLTEFWMGSALIRLFTKDSPEKKLRKTYAHLYIPPSARPDAPVPLVVYTHGNGATIEEAMHWLEFLFSEGFAIFIPEYRGFGHSGGHPGRKEINSDMLWFYDQALQNQCIDTSRIYLYARSLGGGIACDLLKMRPFHKLILESTYYDIHNVVDKWYIPTWLMWDCHFQTKDALKLFGGKTLICHGKKDKTILPWHAEKNASIAQNAQLQWFNATHANIYQLKDYQETVLNFLKT